MNVLEQFTNFLDDDEAAELYITGVAGTGKTTELGSLLEWCAANDVPAVTTAYTHQACNILRSKLPKSAEVKTLHSYLKKRPTINDRALKIHHVDATTQMGVPDKINLLFIDEFSMVGEKDFLSLAELQYDDQGNVKTKIIYIGDPNQLPPVKDAVSIYPTEPHWIKLTKIYRQAGDNPLIDTLIKLNAYINGMRPEPLEEHKTLKRNVDIVKGYKDCTTSKIMLAYTNRQVEALNEQVQGYALPKNGDTVWSPTTRRQYTLLDCTPEADNIVSINGELIIPNSKYKTLETLHKLAGVKFYVLEDENGNQMTRAGVFGHNTFLQTQNDLAKKAVSVNSEIKREINVEEPTKWAKQNWQHPLARKRAKAWAHYLSFKSNVLCIDFAHAMTVHKSQGSTYENVFLDIQDLGICSDNDYIMYLKLLYVAISRASGNVYTN